MTTVSEHEKVIESGEAAQRIVAFRHQERLAAVVKLAERLRF